MATSFAFVAPGNASGNRPAGCALAHAVTLPSTVAREPHVDVLWRLTTKPWARARRVLAPARVPRVIELLETGLLASTALAMAVLTVLALAA